MRKLKYLYLIFGILFYLSCQNEEDLITLDFFEVELKTIPSPTELGVITLCGSIRNSDEIEDIQSQGFIWSTQLEEVEGDTENAQRAAVEMIIEEDFSLVVDSLALDSLYYFRAYIEGIDEEAGTRRVYSDIEAFSFNVGLIIFTNFTRTNDKVLVQGQTQGLESNNLVTEYGFVFSNTHLKPRLNRDIEITADGINNNNIFNDTLTNLEFNTLYYVRSWAKNAIDSVFYSENVLELQVTDGWQPVSNLPTTLVREGLAKAIAVPNGNGAIVGLGSYEDSFSSDIFYRFSLEEDDISGTWDTSIPTDIASNRNDCIAFSYDNSLFVGLGENASGNPLRFMRKLDLSTLNEWSDSGLDGTPDSLTSSVSFIIGNKLYVGTGSLTQNDSEMTEKFWEIDLDNPQGWREVASLPFRKSLFSQLVDTVGRYEAISFKFEGFHYVGGGLTTGNDVVNLGVVNDLWKFIPPIDENDMGSWEFAGFLPGSPRYLAVTLVQNNRVYYGMGDSFNNGELSDWWEYMSNGTWIERTPLPAFGRSDAVTFATGEANIQRGFLGTGTVRLVNLNEPSVQRKYLSDFWEYIPAN